MKLSILVCNLITRSDCLARLLDIFEKQIGDCGKADLGYKIVKSMMFNRIIYQTLPVEVVIASDNKEHPIGEKRNNLLVESRGEYVAFVDDDDTVSDDYILSILTAIEKNPDCVGIQGEIRTDYGKGVFKHSIQFAGWYTSENCFYRTPNHLNPIKRKIAIRSMFPAHISNGEDQIYSDTIRKMLKTEEYIDHPIYFYEKRSV